MRIRQITISAAIAAGLAAPPLSNTEAQYYPQQQPTAQRTTAQLNRDELARLQSGSGSTPYQWAGPPGWGPPPGWGSPPGWGWGYPPCSPFPLSWPFCVAGAVVGTAVMIVTAPVLALTGAPPSSYPPPYYYGPR